MAKIEITAPIYKIGQTIFHKCASHEEAPTKGVIVDIKYSHATKTNDYTVSLGFGAYVDINEAEIDNDKSFV